MMRAGALGAMALLLLVAFAGTTAVGNGTCDPEKTVTLWAGQNIDVGVVHVIHDEEYLYVEYILNEDEGDCGWYITESHLSVVVGTWEDHPQGTNLKVGQFEFTDPTDEGPKYHLYEISWEDDLGDFDWGDTLDIAAHAVVKKVCNGETVQGETAWGEGTPHWKNWAMSFGYKPCHYKVPVIPTGTISYTVSHPGSTSYFSTTINSGGGGNAPDDTYLGWCIDLSATIGGTNDGTLSIPTPTDLKYEEWCMVNWILNNKPSNDWEVIQAAIWNVYIGTPIATGNGAMGSGVNLDDTQAAAATALASAALGHGDFRVSLNEWMAVIVIPDGNHQITIIEVDP